LFGGPQAQVARRSANTTRRLQIEIRREEAGAVGDRHAPGDGTVGPRQFADRLDIDRGFDLVAANRTRIKHAEEPGFVQFAEQRFGDAPGPFDLVGARGNGRRELAGPHHRLGSAQSIHRGTPPVVAQEHCGRSPDPCQ
jgi:hypothetical protein